MTQSFTLSSFYQHEAEEHKKVALDSFTQLEQSFSSIVDVCCEAISKGNKLFFFGNGGSASDAQHLATELTVRYRKNRPPISAIALTTDTSALTAIGNDLGFDFLFSRQLEALGEKGDVAIGISTSGNSANVLEAFKVARDREIHTIAFTGGDGGKLPPLADLCLTVPSKTVARIQEMHITFGQMLCGALEQKLGLVESEFFESA